MARIRTIKPEFWADEKLAPLDPVTRLVFVGLISMADDAGRLLDNLKQIDAFIFPETDDSAREALANLSRISRIRRGTTASGQHVIQIVNWATHQKIDHPNLKSCLPELSENSDIPDIREPLTNDSQDSREPLAPLPVPTTYDQNQYLRPQLLRPRLRSRRRRRSAARKKSCSLSSARTHVESSTNCSPSGRMGNRRTVSQFVLILPCSPTELMDCCGCPTSQPMCSSPPPSSTWSKKNSCSALRSSSSVLGMARKRHGSPMPGWPVTSTTRRRWRVRREKRRKPRGDVQTP